MCGNLATSGMFFAKCTDLVSQSASFWSILPSGSDLRTIALRHEHGRGSCITGTPIAPQFVLVPVVRLPVVDVESISDELSFVSRRRPTSEECEEEMLGNSDDDDDDVWCLVPWLLWRL